MTAAGLAMRRGLDESVTIDIRTLEEVAGGRRVVWVEFTEGSSPGSKGAPLSWRSSANVEHAAKVARGEGMPIVVVLASTGPDIEGGLESLEGWGRVAKALVDCSGVVPTIVVVDGPATSGPALLLGLADLVVMTEHSYAFVNGPLMVAEYTGVQITTGELGGASQLSRSTGVTSLVVTDRAAAIAAVIDLLAYLPSSADEEPARWFVDDPADRPCDELAGLIPSSPTGSYDVRTVASVIVDEGSLLELRDRWAPNVVTALATIDGRPVGVVANQPLALAGTLDIAASQKAARYVAFCDAFNLPILTLVDTPGFYPGKDLEWRGMIRHGAQLVYAYARATVPRVCVIMRKSYGGAYIVMDSKRMGNDVCFAWPSAELAVMGAGQAAAILRRRATAEERAAFESDYVERLLNPYVAAERGYVDAVIEPAETRAAISRALEGLVDKREVLQPRKHGNEPL
jgi:acetyl-CoA carboxylase carboxyltransferase component